jgi:hypothetical protein
MTASQQTSGQDGDIRALSIRHLAVSQILTIILPAVEKPQDAARLRGVDRIRFTTQANDRHPTTPCSVTGREAASATTAAFCLRRPRSSTNSSRPPAQPIANVHHQRSRPSQRQSRGRSVGVGASAPDCRSAVPRAVDQWLQGTRYNSGSYRRTPDLSRTDPLVIAATSVLLAYLDGPLPELATDGNAVDIIDYRHETEDRVGPQGSLSG